MKEIGEIRGCGSEADARWIQQEAERLLGEDELVECASLLHEDVLLFTNWRLLLILRERLGGKKVEYLTVPYYAIVRFSVEAVGLLDLDAEVKIWTSTHNDPVRLQFHRGVNVYDFQVRLARMVARFHGVDGC
jgi:hypothetical protein